MPKTTSQHILATLDHYLDNLDTLDDDTIAAVYRAVIERDARPEQSAFNRLVDDHVGEQLAFDKIIALNRPID